MLKCWNILLKLFFLRMKLDEREYDCNILVTYLTTLIHDDKHNYVYYSNQCNVESTIISQSFDYSLIGRLADVVLSFVPGPPSEIRVDAK